MKTFVLAGITVLLGIGNSSARAETISVIARESGGFSRRSTNIPVESCQFLRRDHQDATSLRIASDAVSAIEFGFTESLALPLRDGVIPTHQSGLDLRYEEGTLFVSLSREEGLRTERVRFSLEIDPSLRNPKEFLGRRWLRDGFPSPRELEVERLYCAF